MDFIRKSMGNITAWWEAIIYGANITVSAEDEEVDKPMEDTTIGETAEKLHRKLELTGKTEEMQDSS